MGHGERAGGAGPGQRRGRQQGAGLEAEHFEVVVQHEHLVAFAGELVQDGPSDESRSAEENDAHAGHPSFEMGPTFARAARR